EAGRTAAYRPAGMIELPSPQQLTARLPNLEVTEVLGRGGMGVVYKGRQPFLDRPVAVKLIRPDFGDDEGPRRRCLVEARALARLTHPYVVSVFDCGRAGDPYYFVMEYVDGTSLRRHGPDRRSPRRAQMRAPRSGPVITRLPQPGEGKTFP